MRSWTAAAALTTALVLASGLPATGQVRQDPDELNALGRECYDQRNFEGALEYFREAWKLIPAARYLFNAAKACVRLDDDECAVHYFRLYLERAPEAPDRAEVEAEIRARTSKLLSAGSVEIRIETNHPAALTVAPRHVTRVHEAPATLFLPAGDWEVTATSPFFGALSSFLVVSASTISPVPVQLEFVASVQDDQPQSPEAISPILDPPSRTRPRPVTAAWVGGAVGVAAGITGAALWGWGAHQMSSANDGYDGSLEQFPGYRSEFRSGRTHYQWGMGLAVSGVVAIGVSTALYLLWPDEK